MSDRILRVVLVVLVLAVLCFGLVRACAPRTSQTDDAGPTASRTGEPRTAGAEPSGTPPTGTDEQVDEPAGTVTTPGAQPLVEISPDKDGFFVEYRLLRERERAKRVEFLTGLLREGTLEPEAKKQIESELIAIASMGEKEAQIENLLVAKGYQDAVAVIGEDSVNVIVKTAGLTPVAARQVGDIATRATGVALHRIAIVERND